MSKKYDAAAICSPLVDVTANVGDELLSQLGLSKGSMHLISEEESKAALAKLAGAPLVLSAGGSAANALAGVTGLGGSGLLIGVVADDDYGKLFANETESSGAETRFAVRGGATGRAITFITPDGERTFATHLGAAELLSPDDINEADIASAAVLHLEGYLLENQYDACVKAMNAAKNAGSLVSLDLADGALVKRISERMHSTVEKFADIVLANEDEAAAFTGERDVRRALTILGEACGFAVIKIGAEGSLIQTGGKVYETPAVKTEVVNTNGAGDMYAAGIIFGLARGFAPDVCGRLASAAAALVVSRATARLREQVRAEDLL